MSMRTRSRFHLDVGGPLPGSAIGAQAANLGFLNDKQDGESATRVNQDAGKRGKIDATMTLTSTAKDGERTCGDLGVVLRAIGQSMNLRPQFSNQGGGTWQLQKKN